jgi:hypothetical protein
MMNINGFTISDIFELINKYGIEKTEEYIKNNNKEEEKLSFLTYLDPIERMLEKEFGEL